jgi:hypothetical protein
MAASCPGAGPDPQPLARGHPSCRWRQATPVRPQHLHAHLHAARPSCTYALHLRTVRSRPALAGLAHAYRTAGGAPFASSMLHPVWVVPAGRLAVGQLAVVAPLRAFNLLFTG